MMPTGTAEPPSFTHWCVSLLLRCSITCMHVHPRMWSWAAPPRADPLSPWQTQHHPGDSTSGGTLALLPLPAICCPLLSSALICTTCMCLLPHTHPQAQRGWSSDPCGPILYRGKYHLFYQHLPTSAQWYWGLCWAHSVSDDLVTWRNLPPAVMPTPGGLDADGCFSGE